VNGWPLLGLLAALESALFAVALAAFGSDEAGMRALVRLTVRVSFLVFIVVYAAAPLCRLFPSPATRWVARNRRYLGVSFAWAHGLHALAIALLAHRIGDAFAPRPVSLIGGGYVYLLVVGMAATSFDRTARWLGPRRWGLLHRLGLHTIWLDFAVSWTSAALRASSPVYLPLALATWGAAGLRLAALYARSRVAEPIVRTA
jgi:methionine sulfoxide reductase heme-binding subunit